MPRLVTDAQGLELGGSLLVAGSRRSNVMAGHNCWRGKSGQESSSAHPTCSSMVFPTSRCQGNDAPAGDANAPLLRLNPNFELTDKIVTEA